MSFKKVIAKAIGVHSLWKVRLKQAIATQHAFGYDISTVGQESLKEFDQWIYSSRAESLKGTPSYKRARELQIQFHQTAARVLELVREGNLHGAEGYMQGGGEFTKVSSDLALHLTHWLKEYEEAHQRA